MSGIFSAFTPSVKKVRRVILFAASFVMAITLISPLLTNNQASAAAPYSDMSLDDLNKSTSYYVTLEGCVQNNMKGTISASSQSADPQKIDWFDNNSAWGYIYPDGKTDCKDIMSKALDLWNVAPDTFLKGMGYSQKTKTSYDWSGTAKGADRKNAFDSYVKSTAVTGSSNPNDPGGAAAYLRYDYWWDDQCVVKKFGEVDKITDSVLKAKIAKPDTETATKDGATITEKYISVPRVNGIKWGYLYNSQSTIYSAGAFGAGSSSTATYDYIAYGYHTTPRSITCADTAKALTQYADDYEAYLNKEAISQACTTMGYSGANLAACVNGKTHNDPAYCATYLKDSDLSKACLAGFKLTDKQVADAKTAVDQRESVDTAGGDNATAADGKSSCSVEGLGWIICPVMSLMSNMLSEIFVQLTPFLQTDIELFNTQSGTYIGWGVFRSIANIIFVIVFLIIIFSQLTSVGVSNYGVKKMLPRLVVAAVLVNVSFFVCQIAVDISNILGVSMKGVFDGIASSAGVQGSSDASANGFGITAIVAGVIGAAVISYFALGILIPVLLGALVAALMIILLLILRKALIVLLIVVSPLAFVAYLLPNTETFFTRWRKVFTSMLMLFPIVAVVFGASSLASQILLGTANGTNNTDAMPTIKIAALATAVLPFFVVPALLKSSMNAIGNIGGRINAIGAKVGSSAGKAGSGVFANTALSRGRAIRKQGRANYRNQKFADSVAKGGNLRSLFAKGPGITGAQKYANASLERSAVAASEEADSKAVKEEALILSREATSKGDEGQNHVKKQLRQALVDGDSVRARAAYSTLTSMGAGGVEDARKVLSDTKNGSGERYIDADKELGNDMKQHIIRNHSDMKSTDNRQMNWATNSGELESTEHFGNLTDGQAATQTPASIKASNLSPERAYRILQDKNISPNIKDPQRDALIEKAAGYAPPVAATAQQTAPTTATQQQAGSAPIPGAPSTPASAPISTAAPTPPAAPTSNEYRGSGPGGLVVPGDSGFNTPPSDLDVRH